MGEKLIKKLKKILTTKEIGAQERLVLKILIGDKVISQVKIQS